MQEKNPRQNRVVQRPPRPSSSERQAPPRRALSPEEKAERERRRAQAEARRREEIQLQRQAAKRARRALGIASLTLAILFVAAYWIFVAVSINTRSSKGRGYYPLLVYTEGELEADFSFKAEEVVFHGTTYLPLTCFQEYFSVTVYGTGSTRSFLMENGDEAKFFLGTDQAEVNGQRVSLSDESFLKEEVLYLPVDFFTDKMNCFRFSYISDKGSNALTFDGTLTPAMTFRGQAPSLPVDRSTIPAAGQSPSEG